MYGTRNVLVLLALHERVAAHFGACPVAVEYVTVFVVGIDDARVVHSVLVEGGTDTVVAAVGCAVLVDKELHAVGRVDETVAHAAHRLEAQDAERSLFGGYLVDDVGVGVGEVIFRVALLLYGDTQLLGVGVVEKQDGAQHGTFSHSLRADEVHIPVQVNVVGIGNVGAVDKDDSIQISHCLPFQCRRKFGYFQSGVPGSARNSSPCRCWSSRSPVPGMTPW